MKGVLIVFVVAFATFAWIWAIGTAATYFTGVPRNFPPFTFLPLLSGVLGGFIGASCTYLVIRSLADRPDRIFFFVALTVLVFSFGLPLRLSFTKSPRFAGVTPAAQMTLALLHTITAAAAVTTLTRVGAH